MGPTLVNDEEGLTTVIRVYLLDDHEVVRRGLRELLEVEEDIEVVGESASAGEATRRIPALRPHVMVLDARLPDGSGIDVCRDVRSIDPSVAGIILTSYDDDNALRSAVLAGAVGYLLKDIKGNDLVASIRRVAAGETLLDSAVVTRLRAQWGHDVEDPRLTGLSPQERRILQHIAEGLTNRQIGETMSLAEKTVKNYVTSVLAKMGLESRTQAAVYVASQASRAGGPTPQGHSSSV
jgi:DNA-binding NarL/FixJ family response regulator